MKTVNVNVWEYLDTETTNCEEVRALVNWSTNFNVTEGTPYQVFLDLIGYSEENFGVNLVSDPERVLGYLELDYLADALKEYVKNPQAVTNWITRLEEIESAE